MVKKIIKIKTPIWEFLFFCNRLYNKIMKFNSKIWSNLFFLAPLIISLYYSLFLYSILVFLLFIFSFLYHISGEKKFLMADKIFAYLLIGSNLFLSYLSNFKEPYFLLAIVSVIFGFYFFYIKKRDDYEWHFFCSMISLFCLLSYIL